MREKRNEMKTGQKKKENLKIHHSVFAGLKAFLHVRLTIIKPSGEKWTLSFEGVENLHFLN